MVQSSMKDIQLLSSRASPQGGTTHVPSPIVTQPYDRRHKDIVLSILKHLAVLSLLFVLTTCQPVDQPLSGDLPIFAPEAINVGDVVHVQVGPVHVRDGTLVGLVMVGKHGPRVYRSTFEEGIARFTIPGEHTMQPGYLALIAAADSARGEAGVLLRPIAYQQNSASIGSNQVISSQATTIPYITP